MASLAAQPTTFLSDARLPILLLDWDWPRSNATGVGEHDDGAGGGLERPRGWAMETDEPGSAFGKESRATTSAPVFLVGKKCVSGVRAI